MQQMLERLVGKIRQADIDPLPSENLYMEDVFDTDVYSEILRRLPGDDVYQFIDHPDAMLPNGRRTRKLLDLTAKTIQRLEPEDRPFWSDMRAVMTSDGLVDSIVKKFASRIQLRFGKSIPEMTLVPIFYRDYPGYYITVHPDASYKIATLQFYLAKDQSQIHLGTSFHLKKPGGFQLLKTNLFQPNSAYAFVRTDESWHSVKQLGEREQVRDTLALTLYIKGTEYQS
jgi:hypothetical protein